MELAELSKLVDEFNQARDKRIAAGKEERSLKSAEVKLKEVIIHEMFENDVRIASGLSISVKMQTKSKPQATDWSLVHKFMVEHDAMDLVQKRLGEAAVKARFMDGVEIPGIEFYEVNDLSVSKI